MGSGFGLKQNETGEIRSGTSAYQMGDLWCSPQTSRSGGGSCDSEGTLTSGISFFIQYNIYASYTVYI